MILTHSFPYSYDQHEGYCSYAPPTTTDHYSAPFSSSSPSLCGRDGAPSNSNKAAWCRLLAAEELRRHMVRERHYCHTELQEQELLCQEHQQAKMKRLKQFVLQEEDYRRAYEAAKLRRMAAEVELNKNKKKPERQTTRRQTEDEQEDEAQQKPSSSSSLLLMRGRDGKLYLVESEHPQQKRQPTTTLAEKSHLRAARLPPFFSQPNFASSTSAKKEKHVVLEEKPAQPRGERADEDTHEDFFASLFGIGTVNAVPPNAAKETQNEKPTTASPFGPAAERNVEKIIAAALGSTTESYQKAAAVSNTVNNNTDNENKHDFVESILKAVMFGNSNEREQESVHSAAPEEKTHKISRQQEKEGLPEEQPVLRWVLGPDGGLYPVQMDARGAMLVDTKTQMSSSSPKQTRRETGEETGDFFGRKDRTSCAMAKTPVVPKATTTEIMDGTRKLKEKNTKTKKTNKVVIIEDASDSESEEDELQQYVWWRNAPSSLGEWMEPVHEA